MSALGGTYLPFDPDARARLVAGLGECLAGREEIRSAVLHGSALGFRHAVTDGTPVLLRDPEAWYAFRERTWLEYLDFAPLQEAVLRDLLGPGSAGGAPGGRD